MSRLAALLLVALLAALEGGCARTIVEGEIETAFADRSNEAALNYWHTLPDQRLVTNAEGLHGILLFADGDDPFDSYEARVEELKQRGWLSKDFDEPAALAMSRGTLAKALAHALELEGGVMMRLTKNSPRYSTMELVYLSIFPPSSPQQAINGLDFVGVISKAQDFVMLREARERERNAPEAGDDGAQPERS